LLELGHSKVFGSANPFSFMEHISLQNKTNFFEARVGAYQKAGVMNKSADERAFALDEEF
jgi:ribonucleotide reductase beta subunit family protein with ferritin-like domain